MTTQDHRIILVVPPFQSITSPALGVSQLKSISEREGCSTSILYLNLQFAKRIGPELYEWISSRTTTVLLGEFIFSYLLFERTENYIQEYLEAVLAKSNIGNQLSRFCRGRSKLALLKDLTEAASEFVQNEAVPEILSRDPWVLGFTSTFQQNCASILILRLIKSRCPDIVAIMGGANCQTESGEELFTQFPEIDFIGQGECDHSFPRLIRALSSGEKNPQINGFLLRDGRSLSYKNGIPAAGLLSRDDSRAQRCPEILTGEDLDKLPYPNFDDYFTQLSECGLQNGVVPGLVMETSRGCWWGAKRMCTFCGLNPHGISFRAKSPARALEEMSYLVNKYRTPRIELTDNILDMKYFKTVLPQLAANPIADIFYETTPNLSREKVCALSRANVRFIQPGIESFSNSSLRLMNKGTTLLQNIQLLKWCAELGIVVAWNYLFGFPGENEEEVFEISSIMDAVHHLQPPGGASVLHLDRSSVYFAAPDQYGLAPISPITPYRFIYPFSPDALARLAYFFQSDFLVEKSNSEPFRLLAKAIAAWREVFYRSHLLAIELNDSFLIIDTRICRRRFLHSLGDMSFKVYGYCDKARNLRDIVEFLGPDAGPDVVESALRSLVGAKLLLEVDGRYLSLATRWGKRYKKYAKVFPGGMVANPERKKRVSGAQKDPMFVRLKRAWWYFHKIIGSRQFMARELSRWRHNIGWRYQDVGHKVKASAMRISLGAAFLLANLVSSKSRFEQ